MANPSDLSNLPPFAAKSHIAHAKRCLTGLPSSQVEVDGSAVALVFYCIGILDLLGALHDDTKVSPFERESWREWIWEQYVDSPDYGAGFRPSTWMTPSPSPSSGSEGEGKEGEGGKGYKYEDPPHVIMTYTALMALALLRDDFSRLGHDVPKFLGRCQRKDGSFSTIPHKCSKDGGGVGMEEADENGGGDGDADLRTVYCAFAISSMLDDWTGVDVGSAVEFVRRCRSYEGGYGQSPRCEAQGGTTYTALATLHLAPSSPTSTSSPSSHLPLTKEEKAKTIRWLTSTHDSTQGGFKGRTNKEADACYCFWCGASLAILNAHTTVDHVALVGFLGRCQFRYGGIAKAPGESSDPYHTYLALAALSLYPPDSAGESWSVFAREGEKEGQGRGGGFDALLNCRREVGEWARAHIPRRKAGDWGKGG